MPLTEDEESEVTVAFRRLLVALLGDSPQEDGAAEG